MLKLILLSLFCFNRGEETSTCEGVSEGEMNVAMGVSTGLGELSLPPVTSHRAYFQNCMSYV